MCEKAAGPMQANQSSLSGRLCLRHQSVVSWSRFVFHARTKFVSSPWDAVIAVISSRRRPREAGTRP